MTSMNVPGELREPDPGKCWTSGREHELIPYVLVNDGVRLFVLYRDLEPALYTFQCRHCGTMQQLTLAQAIELDLIVAMEVHTP